MDRRTDPWGDFLRRMMLSASLASAAASVAPSPEDATPPAEVAEADTARPAPVQAIPKA